MNMWRFFHVPAMPLAYFVLAGCMQYPVTDGFHHRLPLPDTRIVIWCESPVVMGTATTWLQKRGLRIVERAKLTQIFQEQHIRLTHTADDEVPILQVGKLLGAGMVVFIEASPISGGAVSIRGVDIQTSEVLWNGVARYPNNHFLHNASPEDTLIRLTCEALATAWGFRHGEEASGSQSMCSVEEPASFTRR